jgi:RimJ/RimL family protein N-acetyltransferase
LALPTPPSPATTDIYRCLEETDMRIRVATPNDAQAMQSYLSKLYVDGCNTIRQLESVPSLEENRKWLEKHNGQNAVAFIAISDRQMIGLIDAFIHDAAEFNHTCEFGMSVLMSYRNQGVGRQLIESILNWATSKGIELIELNVYSINVPAIHLYKSLGFVEDGCRKGAVKLSKDKRCDFIHMSMPIGKPGTTSQHHF